MRDIVRHGPVRRSSRWAKALRVRAAGLVLYAAVVAWCWFQLPTAMPFVVPGAALGGLVHVGKGRPWWGLLVFTTVVVAVPLLLWPSLGTGAFSNWTDGS